MDSIEELIALKEENGNLLSLYEDTVSKTNRLTVEVEIAQLEFRQVFDAISDAFCVIDTKNTVQRINKTFLDLISLDNKSQAIGRKCYDVFPSNLCHSENCPLRRVQKGNSRIETELKLEMLKDIPVSFILTGTPLLGLVREIVGVVVQIKDVTERKNYEAALENANRKLEKLARTDGLTKLANRRTFDEILQKEWLRMRRGCQPLSVILGDIDFFKSYNDHYGHQQGDACLQEVARCIRSCLRRPADLAARYGGEEFAIILPDTPLEGAVHLAETLCARIDSMKRVHARSEVKNFVTLSLGVSTATHAANGHKPEDLVKSADEALYASKKAGRHTITVRSLGN